MIMKTLFKRLIIDVLLVIAIFGGWWFVAIPFAIIGMWICPFFLEIIIAGIIYDALFGYSSIFGLAGYIGTIISITIFLVIVLLKKVVRKYDNMR